MRKYMLRILVLAVVFALLIPSASMIGNEQSEDMTMAAMVIFPSSAINMKELNFADFVDRVIAPYEGFILAELTQKQKSYLEANGAMVIIEENLYTIGIDGYRFDTRAGEPNIKEELRFNPTSGKEGHYLVQFVGPIKNEWLSALRNVGAEPISYYPYNAMLVKATPEVKTYLGGLECVQWVGDYHPAYKIKPVLMELDDGKEVDVNIMTYSPEGANAVLSSIDKTDIIRGYKGSDFGLIKARLSMEEIERVAALKEVSYIEPYEEMRALNSKIQWVLQTNINNDRRVWDMGVNGSTQVVAISDTGIDYDHNMFRESIADIIVPGHDIYNETNYSRRKLIRYQPMAQWFDDRGLDQNGNGIPEMLEDLDGDGVLEALSDTLPMGFIGTSGHGTTTAGTLASNDTNVGVSANDGGAIGAQIYFMDVAGIRWDPDIGTWDDYFIWIPDDYHWLFIDPYNAGARVHSNSWGAQSPEYTLEARMIDKFMWEYPEFLVIFPTGNKQADYPDVGSPSTAKSVVSVGWGSTAPSQNNVNGQSSTGPTADGRRKPTLVTPGYATTSMSTGNPNDNLLTPGETAVAGGSYASQGLGGAAVLIRDYFEQGFYPNGFALPGNELYPSAALVKAMLMASGEMMTGGAADSKFELMYPNNSQGWGRPLLDNVLYFTGDTRKLLVEDNTEGLNTGQVVEYEFNVTSNSTSLKVFLAWTDYPGSVGASPATVNNLDLQLEAPNGTTFLGNVFASSPFGPGMWEKRGYSTPGGLPDSINTNEGINITTGNAIIDDWVTPGTWKARVIAQNVPAGPQPFGLTITGDLNLSYGIVTIDKKVYSEGDTINIEVRDLDLAAPNNFTTVTSTTESVAEQVNLTETVAGSGVWRGLIDTEFGLPILDGKLQVKEGDTITVTYSDTSPIHVSTATAIVDSFGPIITNVAVKDITNAYAKITWDTDEPSTSKVYYGETPSLEKAPVEVTAFMVNHEVELTGLKTDTIYYFDVESSDWFGHTTRDDNGGDHYTFRTIEKTEILIIYGDETTFDREDRYRSALEAYGWTYNEWFSDAQGDPPLPVLQEYKVVIWQTGYEQYPAPSDTQRPIITDYLDGGGRLFVTSHDIAWGLCDPDSPFGSPERCAWFNATMKVKWTEDLIFGGDTSIEGISGNEISGDYSGGVPYKGHREGAIGDEVECTATDGLCEYTWRSVIDAMNPEQGYIAIQWTSSSPNGTPGVGVWGGFQSKMVAFFLEWTRINAVIDNDPWREDILDKVIKWLLDGRDHPDVQVVFPNGGETFSTGPVIINWTASTFGTGIDKQFIYISDNAGQSWTQEAELGPAAINYSWDISTLPNGNRYMVKVVVQDDGIPKLIGSDASDGTFSIIRPGGDLEGPITVPGSIKVWPNYVDSGSTAWFNATVDDSDRGNSTIMDAEYFIQCAEPEALDYGTGTGMNAMDGTFDTPIEDVTWNGIITKSSGWYTIWIHGRDSAGNWGTFESEKFLVLDGINPPDLTPPLPPASIKIALEGASLEDLNITWDMSPDDDLDPTHVEYYEIFYSESYATSGTGYRKLTSIPATASPNYYFVNLLAGNANPNNYFYHIGARDQSCNYGMNETQVAKYNRTLTAGKNLVSIPLMLEDESISTVLQTAVVDIVWFFDAADPMDPWKSYNPSKAFNKLTTINYTMALWIDAPAETSIVIAGKVPASATIQLQKGWNFVGYPSFIWRSIADALSLVDCERVEGYDVNPPEYLKLLRDNDNMITGYGYWVKAGSTITWTLTN